eukprot:Gb_09101 [translate_table: standard]
MSSFISVHCRASSFINFLLLDLALVYCLLDLLELDLEVSVLWGFGSSACAPHNSLFGGILVACEASTGVVNDFFLHAILSEVNFEALERLLKMYFSQEFEVEFLGAIGATPSAFVESVF